MRSPVSREVVTDKRQVKRTALAEVNIKATTWLWFTCKMAVKSVHASHDWRTEICICVNLFYYKYKSIYT